MSKEESRTAIGVWADGAQRNALLWNLGAFLDLAMGSRHAEESLIVETIEALTELEEEHEKNYKETKWPEQLALSKFFGQAAETLQEILKSRPEALAAQEATTR